MEWSASLVLGPWGNFPNIVICWEAAVWLDCILCLILTPDGHPPVQEIHAESGVCCPYPLRLVASLAVGRCGQVGLGSGSWPQGERSSRPPHAGLQRREPRVISLTEASALVPQAKGLGDLLVTL